MKVKFFYFFVIFTSLLLGCSSESENVSDTEEQIVNVSNTGNKKELQVNVKSKEELEPKRNANNIYYYFKDMIRMSEDFLKQKKRWPIFINEINDERISNIKNFFSVAVGGKNKEIFVIHSKMKIGNIAFNNVRRRSLITLDTCKYINEYKERDDLHCIKSIGDFNKSYHIKDKAINESDTVFIYVLLNSINLEKRDTAPYPKANR